MPVPVPQAIRAPTDGELIDVARHSLRFVPALGLTYVNNPKAGCSTVKTSLATATGRRGGNIHGRTDGLFVSDVVTDQATWDGYRAARRFSVVRNPFARALSGYLDKTQREDRRPSPIAENLKARYGVEPGSLGFTDLLALFARDNPWEIDPHFAPQSVNLLVGHLDYDHIGHLESVADTLGRYGLPVATYERHSVGATARLAVYEDGAAVDLVRRLYADDFATFGYSDDPADQAPVRPVAEAAMRGEARLTRLMEGLVGLSLRPRRRERRLRRGG